MIIRKALLSDVDQLSLLFDKYRMFYDKPSDIEAGKSFLADRISKNESEIFVAIDKVSERLTGFVQLYPLFSSTRLKRLWLLNDLFVEQDFRGQGISKALINAAKELCNRTGACAMTLETAKTNAIGNNLYPATGFVVDKEHNFYEWANE